MKESVMSEHIEQHVETKSAEFKRGVEAGLKSAEDTRNWEAGNELGQELKAEDGKKESVESETPLFLKGAPGGNQGNAQDEKDETEE
jgi:hypothetical protein